MRTRPLLLLLLAGCCPQAPPKGKVTPLPQFQHVYSQSSSRLKSANTVNVVLPPVLQFANAAVTYETNIIITPVFSAQVIGMQSNRSYAVSCVYGTNNWETQLGPRRGIPAGASNGWWFRTYELPPSPFNTANSFRVLDVTP
jgi:hypothetical protein